MLNVCSCGAAALRCRCPYSLFFSQNLMQVALRLAYLISTDSKSHLLEGGALSALIMLGNLLVVLPNSLVAGSSKIEEDLNYFLSPS